MEDLIQKMSTFELGFNVTITGVALVFSMLVLLVLILIIFGKVSVALLNAAEKKAAKAREATLSKMTEDSSDNQTVAAVINHEDGIGDEVIAVISAAVSTLYMGTSKKPVIKAIKKSSGRRTSWGNAGVANNTRSF